MKATAPEGWKSVLTPCQEDPESWYSDNPARKEYAKGVCGTCPLKVDCKKTAIELREKHGIWGGTDFSSFRLPKVDSPFCRSGKHKLPEVRDNNRCDECRKETQRAWELKQARDNTPWYQNKVEKKRLADQAKKNKIGGTCNAGHHLDLENTITRTDGSLACRKCIHKPKNPVGLGNLNSGSRNHG